MHNKTSLTARPIQTRTRLRAALRFTPLLLAHLAVPLAAPAATVWTGPMTNFSKAAFADPTQATNQDRITANVWITRGNSQGLYNAAKETGYGLGSPADTEWAYGTTANYASLPYTNWLTWVANNPPSSVGQAAVLHLITDDIYMDITFTSWADGHLNPGGAFSYQRSTPGPLSNSPPSVTITNPIDGAVFGAPANFTISAMATDTDGSVTNVQFFDSVSLLGNAASAPYNLAVSLAAGSHPLSAVATDNLGASSTSAVVNVTVTSTNALPTVAITNPPNGATMTTPTNVTIQASASDTDGTVVSVQFFDGATSLGTALTAPFSISADFYPGPHSLTAVATDNSGGSTTSAVVTVTVSSVVIADPIPAHIPKGDLAIEVQTVADGLAAPIGMAVPDDGSGRMFVYDQAGLVWIVLTNGTRLSTPLLDVRSRLVLQGAYDERGLIGLAVHPNFTQKPYLYTFTSEPYGPVADFQSGLGTTNNHQSVLAEWHIDIANSNLVDVSTRREIMRIDKPQANHNGGATHFGPDGYVYITLGDGGQANDVGLGHVPGGNAQDTNRIWGKIIRIDVDGTNSPNGQYGIPNDNPFVGGPGLDEIYAYGLRNPFSFGFDRLNGTLYLGDVGQNKVEEVDIITKGGDYGWNVKEGTFWFDPALGQTVTAPARPVPAGLIDPIAEYDHDEGLVVLVGNVYRGTQIPGLAGKLVFGDWGTFTSPSGRLFYLDTGNVIKEFHLGADDRRLGLWIRGFGEGPDGEQYIFCSRMLGPTGGTGKVLKIVPLPNAVTMTAIGAQNGANIATAWTGGNGPFAVQKKSSLSDAAWQNVAFTTARAATNTTDTPTGFFRSADVGRQYRIPLTAYLSGAGEVPTNSSAGVGQATFMLDGNRLSFDIRYSGLGSTAIAAHIHGPATTTTTAGVLINFAPFHIGAFGTSGVFSGAVTVTDTQRAYLLAGKCYFNIHTTVFGGGEIRGQIAPVAMQVALTGTGNPVATGYGTLTLVHTQLTLNVTYRGLTGPANGSHIHGPAGPTGTAGVLVPLDSLNGGSYGTSGALSGTVALTPTELGYVIDGQTYINFHTAANPNGELRGQILPYSTAVPATVLMSGQAERPAAVVTSGTGAGTFGLDGSTLYFSINYSGLSGTATAAHIHGPAPTTSSTNVLVDLSPYHVGAFSTAGTFAGNLTLTTAQRDALLNGMTYVNIHTAANPGGEIRGQIALVLMWSSLSGVNERPNATASPAVGSGTFALVRDNLILNATYSGLLSAATASHIHGPASLLGSAGVLVPLDPLNGGVYGTSGGLSGSVSLVTSNLLSLIDGSTYVNFHTTNNPSGEIRGQIVR